MLKKVPASVLISFVLFLSIYLTTTEQAKAALVPSASGTISVLYIDQHAYVPGNSNWLYPSTTGGATDLTLKITTSNSQNWNEEFMVYLQRPVDGVWITVGHAGFPTNGTKTVTFTREYNTTALYRTTPYRFKLVNNTDDPDPYAPDISYPIYNIYYSAY